MRTMNIPVGVSDFEEFRKNDYYYIDKSGLIEELLSRTGTKVTLITRPRRFGKTLAPRHVSSSAGETSSTSLSTQSSP